MKLLKRIVQLPVERQALQSRVSADSKPVGGGGGRGGGWSQLEVWNLHGFQILTDIKGKRSNFTMKHIYQHHLNCTVKMNRHIRSGSR